MWRPDWISSVWPLKSEAQAAPGASRDRIAKALALATVVCVGAALLLSKGTQLFMPGPLASAHGGIEKCSACHTKNGDSKLSWVHGLVAGDPLADSKACLTCHKMPDTAFNAHGASADVLEQSTRRLTKIAGQTPQPHAARAQAAAFPTHDVVERGLFCATCHQEHRGANFDLAKISNEQCRSCHVVKFDSFDGRHPQFEAYPFKRRSRIIYDHAGHFGKHFPEVAKKTPARRIPNTCSACHNSREDKRVMAVAPFEQTCTGCHLDQIAGKERASGPKGIAFLSVPGLDLVTLKKKKASVGEWPDASEADLTPFMKMMISRNEDGRALIKAVDSLNLQDLTAATDEQIRAVTRLAWEIKGLFHALISGKASDVLGTFNIGGGATLSPGLVTDLTASIPRDVIVSAQQQWLPNLATEMANRPQARDQKQSVWSATIEDASPGGATSEREARASEDAAPAAKNPSQQDSGSKPAQPQGVEVKTYTTNAGPEDSSDGASGEDTGGPIKGRSLLPSGTPRAIEARRKDAEQAGDAEPPSGKTEKEDRNDDVRRAGDPDRADKPSLKEGGVGNADAAPKPDATKEAQPPAEEPPGKATEQTDDLLFPTEDELRAIKAGTKSPAVAAAQSERADGKAEARDAKPDRAASKEAAIEARADAEAGSPASGSGASPKGAAPVISIASDVDPESWADYGGWYRQDYAIYYRPTGHKDKFVYSWLVLTGPHASKGNASPATAVFDALTGKDAQGSCTKCHSIDNVQGKGRLVNFSSASAAGKQGRFTSFIHEPHFGSVESRGCLTCHNLEKERPYLKSYEQGNPHTFSSNFGAVKKDLCQSCHTSGMARQDCLLCHSYHVNGVTTPIMNTKLPTQ
jgi:hypothetical protein